MKRIFVLFLPVFLLSAAVLAQPGGFQRQTAEERVAAIHAKLDSAFKTDPAKLAVLDTALTVLFKQQEEKMREMFASGVRPDRETMMAERKKYTDARDEMIKAVLKEEEFVIWKEKIEPSMYPQRPQGGGFNRNRDN